jgi:hypothetical protein
MPYYFSKIGYQTPELERQLSFLIRWEFKQHFRKYKQFWYYLFGFTILTLLSLLMPDNASTVSAKGVFLFLTGMMWIVAIVA